MRSEKEIVEGWSKGKERGREGTEPIALSLNGLPGVKLEVS